jgi:4-alpha-glucanotransferase
MLDRRSGILLHVSSLPSPYGIGDLGEGAYRFVDFLVKTKQTYWQILPLNPTEPVLGNSPYSSSSTYAVNTLFISPELLIKEGLLKQEDCTSTQSFSEDKVSYKEVAIFKDKILDKAFQQLKYHKNICEEFRVFREHNSFWLNDYALFVALKIKHQGAMWTDWPAKYKNRDPLALKAVEDSSMEEIEKVKFLQFLFFKQWFQLKTYAQQKGVLILGDIPIYVSFDSADVWKDPQFFKLDSNKNLTVVAGVPPDYFSETGQRWGNPIYNWDKLKETGFQWWINRIKFNLNLFDVIRIDHFRGFVNFWEIPAEEKTAIKGRWQNVPTYDFFAKLKESLLRLPIIAEDLGILTNEVREAMEHLDFPGMKILLFAFGGNLNDNIYLPHHYVSNCVVYTGTHDNNTTVGWYQNDASVEEKRNMNHYLHKDIDAENAHWELIQAAFYSQANLAIIPFQDFLGLDQSARMNKPGTVGSNWEWRLKTLQVSEELVQQLTNRTLETHRSVS